MRASARIVLVFILFFSGLGGAYAQDAVEESTPLLSISAAEAAESARRFDEALALYEQALKAATSANHRGYIVYRMALVEEKRAQPAQALERLRARWDEVATSAEVADLDLFVARLERQLKPAAPQAAVVTAPASGMRISASDLERRNAMRGPWVTMGSGFLGAVAGGALILGSRQEEALIERYERECQSDPSLCEGVDLDQAARRADAKFYGGIGAAGLGVATLTGGIIWFVKRKKAFEGGQGRASQRVELSPWSQKIAAHRYQGVGVSVRF